MAIAIYALGAPQHARLREARAPIAAVTQAAQPTGELVEITATDGFTTRLGVVRDLSHDQPRPVVVILGGHRTGRAAAQLVGEPGRLAVVAVDYPYDGPDRVRGVGQVLRHAPGMRRAVLNTPRALSQAVDWVLTQAWADPAQVELVGVSLGVPFAAAAGAQDARFSRVWLIQGSADNHAWLEHGLERKIAQPWLRSLGATVVHRLAHGETFRTTEWIAMIAPRPVVVVGAESDQRLPRALVEGLYAAAGEPRELVWVAGGHVNPRRLETVQPLLQLVRSRM